MWWPLVFSYARKYWKLGAIAVILVAFISLFARIEHLRAQRDELTIERNNAEALADTLRERYHNDSTVVVGILAITRTALTSYRDSLKKEKAGKAKTVTSLVATPKPVLQTHEVERDTTSVIQDSVIGPPADIRATVNIGPRAAVWVWDVRPTPIPITVDVGCREKFKPDVLISTPPWVTVGNVETVVRRDVCGNESQQTKHGVGWYLLRGGLVLSAYIAGRARVP